MYCQNGPELDLEDGIVLVPHNDEVVVPRHCEDNYPALIVVLTQISAVKNKLSIYRNKADRQIFYKNLKYS